MFELNFDRFTELFLEAVNSAHKKKKRGRDEEETSVVELVFRFLLLQNEKTRNKRNKTK